MNVHCKVFQKTRLEEKVPDATANVIESINVTGEGGTELAPSNSTTDRTELDTQPRTTNCLGTVMSGKSRYFSTR